MKKITLLLLTILYCVVGYSQFPQNFEDASVTVPNGFPAGWLVTDNGVGTSINWTIVDNSSIIINGSKSAYSNRQEIGINNTSEDWLISPSALIPVNGQLRFFTRQTLAGDQGTRYQIRVSTGTTQSALSSYTVLQEWTESQLNATFNAPEEKVINLPSTLNNTTVFIAFVRVYTQPTASLGGDRWIVDDINVVQRCVNPSVLDANGIAASSANLFWTAAAGAVGYQIEVLPSSSQPTGIATHTSTTNSFLVPSLTQNTSYKYYVRSNCGNGNFSDWVGPFNFQTLAIGTACSDPIVIPSLPYQTFNNTGSFGNTLPGPQAASCIPGGVNYQSGNDVFYSYTAAENCTVSFTLSPTEARSSMFIYSSCAGLTGPCLAGVGNTTSAPRIINFAVTAGTTYIIVISSNLPTATVGYNLLIQCESCPTKPSNLTVSNATLTGADFAWTAPVPAPLSYQVAVQSQGSTVPTGAGQYTGITTPNFTPTDLTSGTLYQYWVRSECAPGVFSAWVGPILFNTQICAPTDQCTYIFRMTDSANNGWNGARMQIRQNGIVLQTIGASYGSGAGPVDVSVALCNNIPFDIFWSVAGLQPQQCIVSVINSFGQTIATVLGANNTAGTSIYTNTVNCTTPVCTIPPTNVTISSISTTGGTINWEAPGLAAALFDIYILPSAGATPPIASTTPTYSGVPGFSFATTIPLLADTNYDVYVRVQCNAPSNSAWSLIKTFKTLPTCPKPTLQTVTGTTTPIGIVANTVSLGWTPGALETQWEVLLLAAPNAVAPAAPGIVPAVGAGDFWIQNITGTAGVIQTLSSTTTPALPALANATIYYYYVRAVCQPGNDASTWTGPFIFNTDTCAATDKCVYKFILTNVPSTVNNWSGGRIQVRQNGIVVATLGTSAINNPNGVSVSICNNVPFDLFWSIAGTQPQGIGVTVIDVNNDIVFTKLPGQGTPLTQLYSDTILGNCQPPTCPKPTNLLVTSAAQTTATLSWTEVGTALQWEVYVVAEGGTPPVNGSPLNGNVFPYYLANTNTDFLVSGLAPSTRYQYYVRAICSTTDISNWTLLTPRSFITKPVNDECSLAITVPVNLDRICAQTVTGNTLGGTASAELSTCPGSENDDVWYSFVATNAFHIITFSNIVGTTTNIRYAVYSGADCSTMSQIFCSATNVNSNVMGNLVPGNTYKIRVYTNGNNINQSASFTLCITTPAPITNDECLTAIPAVVNQGLDCTLVTPGSITGATASSQPSTCAGTEDDDVWFSFVATSATHIITLQNIVGTNLILNSSLYSGSLCDNLTFISCNNTNQTLVNNLTPGTTYVIRIWSGSAQLEDILFNLCIGTIVPPITVNTTEYTNPELVTDVLIKATCATVSNITWATGTTPATNGIGYFNRGPSNFPFEDGIVMVTGSATSAVGPNTSILSGGGLGGDADLSAILAAQNPPQNGSLNNATKLEFDFVALTTEINFNFIFASDEYGTFQCGFSDAFAFILTDITDNTPAVNLAVIPGTNPPVPVSVVNIRDTQYNAGCPSANVAFFGNYYNNPAGVLGAPVNFNGITIPMTASSPVIPGHSYHIKMVIADYNDGSYDSAVFLEGGSFDIGNIELPDDYLIATGTALCEGDDIILDSELDPALYDIQWFNGENSIPGATGPTLTISESGTYFISAAYVGTDCETIDSVVVEYFVDSIAAEPEDLIICNPTGQGIFNLISTKDTILAPFPAGTHDAVYFLSEADAIANNLTNAISQAAAESFLGTNGQEIFVRVNFLTTSCYQIVSFNLLVQDLTPQFTLSGDLSICPLETTTITVIPTNNDFDINLVSYEWKLDSVIIPTATSSSLQIVGQAGYGTYTVTVNNSGCTSSQTFEIVSSTDEWDITFNGTASLCPDETGVLTAVVTNNTNNAPVGYEFTLPNGSQVQNNSGVLNIDETGTYTVEVDILGCTSSQTFEVFPSTVVWNVTFGGTSSLCPLETGTVTAAVTNNTNNTPVTYTFTLPDGSQVVSASGVLNINQSGVYTVVADILGCESLPVSYTVNPSVANWQITFTDTPYEICTGESVTLAFTANNFDINNTNATYTWTSPTGISGTGKTFVANQIGTYQLSVNILGCISNFTVEVVANTISIEVDFVQGCQNNAYRLIAEPFNSSFDVATSSFTWSGPSVVLTDQANVVILKANGDYSVTVTNAQGCSSTKNITVNNTLCTIQKGISPNNDGDNDFFDLSALNVKELFIYNRYGTAVYQYETYTNQWGGQSNSGDELPDGTYFYMVRTVAGESITGWIFINR